jgi:uncharacterized protein
MREVKMNQRPKSSFTAFEGPRRIASGELAQVALKVKEVIDREESDLVLIFDDVTGEQIDVDIRGTAEDLLRKLSHKSSDDTPAVAPADPDRETSRGPGRPRLGVVAREVTLLPRHWDWLNGQPGGASVALRKLVEEARRVNEGRDRVRRAQEAAYRFMSAMGGNLPGFEEASRALFANQPGRVEELVRDWPEDIREYLIGLVREWGRSRTEVANSGSLSAGK